MSLADDIRALAVDGLRAFQDAKYETGLEEARVRYLGRKGGLRKLAKRLREIDPSERAEAGKALNEVKKQLEGTLRKRKKEIPLGPLTGGREERPEDLSIPGKRPRLGHIHPVTRTIREMVAVFERLGFSVAEGPEVETEWHNFTALNIPAEHPSHDPFDTFYVEGGRLLRSHTSPVQVRVMHKTPPPVRVIVPGRVYRPDKVDATHYHTFHQLEGLAVEEGISFADLKACLTMFAKGVFGEDVRTRFRPSFFPFTEPSAEVDIEHPLPRRGVPRLQGDALDRDPGLRDGAPGGLRARRLRRREIHRLCLRHGCRARRDAQVGHSRHTPLRLGGEGERRPVPPAVLIHLASVDA